MNKRKKNKQLEKPAVPLTSTLFTKLIAYFLTDSYRERSFVTKLRTFFTYVNVNIYTEDGDIKPLYDIVRTLEALTLDDNLRDSNLMIERLIESPKDGEEVQEILEGLYEDEDFELDSSTALYIENEIIDRLNYLSVEPLAQKMKLAISKLENQDFSSYSEIVGEIANSSSSLSKTIMSRSVS